MADTYRPLSILAVMSGVLGGLSVLAWIAPSLVSVAAIAALCGGVAVMRLWGRKADVAGIRLAIAGCAVSSICLSSASLWHWHRYTIEIPTGFERVELSEIFDAEIDDVTPALLQLQGRRIAVKAYMDPFYSPDSMTGFTISRMDSTGFGATARPGEQLVVELAAGSECNYGDAPVVVSGQFVVERGIAADGSRFRLLLRNATLRPATSAIGLPMRNPRTC